MSSSQERSLRRPFGLALRVPPLRRLPGLAFARLVAWSERYRARVRLEDLDDLRLRDVGLTREQIEREMKRRAFWMIW